MSTPSREDSLRQLEHGVPRVWRAAAPRDQVEHAVKRSVGEAAAHVGAEPSARRW